MLMAEEALEYLSVPDVLQGRRPGEDRRCDEAVSSLCREYREDGVAPIREYGARAYRACGVLLQYAEKYLTEAALAGKARMLEEGLLAIEVAEAVKLEPREAGRTLDRYILLVGTLRAETPLLSTAARLGLSEELKDLIKRRLAAMA